MTDDSPLPPDPTKDSRLTPFLQGFRICTDNVGASVRRENLKRPKGATQFLPFASSSHNRIPISYPAFHGVACRVSDYSIMNSRGKLAYAGESVPGVVTVPTHRILPDTRHSTPSLQIPLFRFCQDVGITPLSFPRCWNLVKLPGPRVLRTAPFRIRGRCHA